MNGRRDDAAPGSADGVRLADKVRQIALSLADPTAPKGRALTKDEIAAMWTGED